LSIVRHVRGPANAKLVAALLNFTACRFPTETFPDDLQLARNVFADLRKALAEDSPDLAVAQLALASIVDLSPANSAEAELLARDAVVRIRHARENGVSPHPDTSAAMQFFAWRNHVGGRLRHALPMAEQLNADVKFGSVLTYGPPIERTLGRIYYDLGHYEKGVALLEHTALTGQSAGRPLWTSPQRENLYTDCAYLGDAYRNLNRLTESRRILEMGLAEKLDIGEEHDRAQDARAAVRGELGYTALSEEKFTDAEALLREALDEYSAELARGGPTYQWIKHRPRGRIVSGLGQALAGQGKFAEAEPLVIGGFSELMANRETFWGDPTRMCREAGEAVVRFYRAWDKPDKAVQWEQMLANR
jgi:tetratricopeptide (TPR) repeat protein